MSYGNKNKPLVKVDITGEVSNRLNEFEDKNPIYVSDYGVSYLKTAAENTPQFQQAIIDAETQGRPVILPYVPEGQWIDLNSGIAIETGGISILGYGLNTRFRQTVYPNPIFDVIAPNVKIEGFHATSTTFTADNTNGTRGHMTKSYHAGVIAYNDNIHVRNIKVDNMINGALFFAYDVANNTTRANIKNCSVDGLEVTDVDFGLSAKYLTDFTFNNIKGSYKQMPGSNTPPHLVYIVGTIVGENINVNGSNLSAIDGTGDLAFKFSGIKGGKITNISARNCEGFIWVQENENLLIDTLSDWDDANNLRTGASLVTYGTAKNIVISNVFMQMTENGKCIRLSKDGNGTTLRNIKAIGNYTIDDMTLSTPVDLQGTNVLVENIEVDNVGTVKLDASIHAYDAYDVTISNPKTSGDRYGVMFKSGDGFTLKNFEKLKGTDGILSVDSATASNVKVLNEKTNDGNLIAHDNAFFLSDGKVPEITTSGKKWEGSGITDFLTTNGGVRRITTTTGGVLLYITTVATDVEVSANVELKNREGLALKIVDESNYLMLRLDDQLNSVRLFKFDAGVATVLTETPLTFQLLRRYDVKFSVFGDLVEGYVDGQKVLTHTLTTDEVTKYGSATKHGIRGNGAPGGIYRKIKWRNLKAY